MKKPTLFSRWRRLLSLALLGTAVALVVVQMTRVIQHDVDLILSFPSAWQPAINQLDLTVVEEEEVVRHAVFRFDDDHPARTPLLHTLALARGMYRLELNIMRKDQVEAVRFVRPLEVSGSGVVSLMLP
ncbi:MAG: hypothetical protein JRF33_03485 [Deltaproteobacteria bacterium]|nr:hypothetical protein [Deltaproteobacteria bacterium]